MYYSLYMSQIMETVNTAVLTRSILATIMAMCLVLQAAPALCEEVQQDTQENQTEPATSMNFVDKYHAYLQGRVNQPAVWFDNFFGDPETDDDELPTSFVRLRISAQYTEGEGFHFPTRLRANIKLPRASQKLRLIVAGESEEELQASANKDTSTTLSGEKSASEKNTVGLRYTLYKTLRAKLNFGGGVSNIVPLEYYGRVSYRRLIHIGKENVIRFTQSGFWDSVDGHGETSRLDLERAFAHEITGRLSLSGTYYDSDPDTEINKGLNWGIETSFFKHLTNKTVVAFDLGTYGVTRPEREITNYKIASRLRTNTLRPWLFWEIEPAVTFPRDEITGESHAIGAITVMMEIQFTSS